MLMKWLKMTRVRGNCRSWRAEGKPKEERISKRREVNSIKSCITKVSTEQCSLFWQLEVTGDFQGVYSGELQGGVEGQNSEGSCPWKWGSSWCPCCQSKMVEWHVASGRLWCTTWKNFMVELLKSTLMQYQQDSSTFYVVSFIDW